MYFPTKNPQTQSHPVDLTTVATKIFAVENLNPEHALWELVSKHYWLTFLSFDSQAKGYGLDKWLIVPAIEQVLQNREDSPSHTSQKGSKMLRVTNLSSLQK